MIGIDPDLERLEVARKKYQSSNIEYLEGRAENIPGDNYDVVFTNYVLHWCKDPDLVFKNVYRSLKSGGKFGFVVNVYFDVVPTIFTSDMVSSEIEEAFKGRMHPLTIDQYKNLLTTNNFEIVYAQESQREWKFTDVFNFIEILRAHTHGDFDMTHFNVDVMKQYHGEGEVKVITPFCMIVAHKI